MMALTPFSRFEQWPIGFILDLYLAQPIDLDGGSAPDVHLIAADFFSADPIFTHPADFRNLPENLAFVQWLTDNRLRFIDESFEIFAVDRSVVLIPEPSSALLIAVGVSAAVMHRRRRSQGR